MRGVIIINGYPTEEKFYTQAEKIQAALQKLGARTDVLKNGDAYGLLDGGAQTSLSKEYRFVVYLDKDKYLGYLLEQAGLRLFNSARAVEICDDKMTTYLALAKSGLRLAKTIPAPLCYNTHASVNENFLQSVVDELKFPLVVKTSYGSFGAGVHLVPGMPELKDIAQKLLRVPHFYQEYIHESSGRDIRVIVVGGRALGGMERVAEKGEFRSNIELGGVGSAVELTKEYIDAAERAASVLGLDYCGVDLLESKDGPVLCEVNSNAFFEGFEGATGIDVAGAYAAHILNTIQG